MRFEGLFSMQAGAFLDAVSMRSPRVIFMLLVRALHSQAANKQPNDPGDESAGPSMNILSVVSIRVILECKVLSLPAIPASALHVSSPLSFTVAIVRTEYPHALAAKKSTSAARRIDSKMISKRHPEVMGWSKYSMRKHQSPGRLRRARQRRRSDELDK